MTLEHIIKSTAQRDAGILSYILLLVRALFNREAKYSAADPARKHGCGHLQSHVICVTSTHEFEVCTTLIFENR